MKRFLFISVLLMATRIAFAQPGNVPPKDTICVDVKVYETMLTATMQGIELKTRIATLTERISGYEAAVKVLQAKDSATVAGYEREIGLMKEQRKELERIIKIERRKGFWTKVGSGLVTAALTLLLLRK